MALNDMEREYETAYIKAALIRSHHLEPHTSFSLFLRAICTFSGREYKYDPAQRVDTVIYHDEKEFMTSKNSKWQRGRRIVSYLTEVFRARKYNRQTGKMMICDKIVKILQKSEFVNLVL